MGSYLSPEAEFDADLFRGRVKPEPKPTLEVATPAVKTSYEEAAEADLKEVAGLRRKFELASRKNRVPTEILAGIASRESRAGKHLNKEGYDPEKQAYGIMQVDERFHKREGKTPDDQAHIDQAARILRQYRDDMDKKHPEWPEQDRWRAAVASYNFGPGNVKSLENLDKGTTGNNYSEDVMQRARVYRERLWARGRK